MKKKILLVGVLQFFLVLGSCSSNSGDEPTTPSEGIKGEIKADYIADIISVDDFVIGTNNNVFFIGQTPNEDYLVQLKRIDETGKVTFLKGINDYKFLANKLSTTSSGDILLIAFSAGADSDKIFRFENNFSELNLFYTMKPISSPFTSKSRLISICDNKDNTYFVFDYNSLAMKRFVPNLNTDILIAGSGKKEIKDGTGLDVGFGEVSQVISQNNILYIIDNLLTKGESSLVNSNIRKLEYVDNQWKVTTLISSRTDYYTNIAFDSKNDLYVLIKNKGIYKLNPQDNTLSSFKEGEIKIGKEYRHYSMDIGDIKNFKIKNNDLYLVAPSTLFKISDFQSKFNTIKE